AELIGRNIEEVVPFVPLGLFDEVRRSGVSVAEKCLKATFNTEQLHPSYWEVSIGPLFEEEELAGYVLSTVEVGEREHLLQQRDDFAAALSHNLKIPMLGADRTLDVLLQGMLGPLTPGQKQVLETLRESNLHLLCRLQDLIEVYRFDTGSQDLRIEYLNLTDLLDSCCRSFAHECGSRNLTILPLIKPKAAAMNLIGDQRALTRMLTNVLDNAVKFSPDSGVIEVLADRSADGKAVVIQIKDSGPGLKIKDTDQLFRRFWQGGENSYSAVTGLGLYLCNLIAKAHSGRIEAQNNDGKGAMITITLPGRVRNSQ
ncbi:MAG TPA: HAMP domain-containing sensor histidine kinase, partial [Chroococcales cyanobacterium]